MNIREAMLTETMSYAALFTMKVQKKTAAQAWH
jgi:hypothetical protein